MSNNEEVNPNQESADTEVPNNEEVQAEEALTLEEKLEGLTAELEQALSDAEVHKDTAIRAKAEAENIRRRSEREVANASKFALERFAKEILAVVDSLEKALESPAQDDAQKAMREGVELTYKLLIDTLAKFSIEQISPLGDSFDPELHEAMVMQESDEHEPNTVMHVVQMGYALNKRLIRPARVVVSKGKPVNIDEKA
jgi:molecular chaperone GrpE